VNASHPGPVAGVSIAVTGYAIVVGRSASGTALVFLAVLAGQLTIGWQNDAIDAARDVLVARRDKPIATGDIGRRTVVIAAGVAAIATVIASFASGWRAATVHLVAVASAASYNAWLKSGPFSILPYAVSFGLLPAFVTLGARPSVFSPWWVVAGASGLGCAAHILNVLPDRELDLSSGVRSLPHRLSPKTDALLAALFALFASACLAFGPGKVRAGVVAGFCVTALLALAGAIGAGRRSRNGFRAIVVLAVADVALLFVSVRLAR
jgi:4-hydroxybenzoate polyprenyltransferase